MVPGLPKREPRAPATWLLIAGASLVPALLNAFTTYLNSRFARGTAADWSAVAFAGVLWLSFGMLTPIPYVLARRFPWRRSAIAPFVLAHVAGALLLCLLWTTVGISFAILLNRMPPQETVVRYYLSWLLVNLPWAVFLYFAVLGSVYAFTYYTEARERESQQAQLAAQLAEAHLGALRMQLNPHFLFNSLNAITVLVRDEKTRDASRMLELLSGLLRQVLQSRKDQEVTLDRELRFTERYLAIEQVRFSDRLRLSWSIDDSIRDAMVPEFILQPLVENAVRHGVSKLGDAGTIEIAGQQSDGEVILSVRDNGPGFRPDSAAGVGLANTRARLATLFGNAGVLQVEGRKEGGTVATIRFPLRKRTDGPDPGDHRG